MSLRLLPVILAALGASSLPAADATCKILFDANAKVYGLPTHMYQTETAAFSQGAARSSELIYLNNKTYISIDGKWRVSPSTPQQMAALQKEADQTGLTCKTVRDEAVNGEAATLYSSHRETPDVKSDTQIWISKSKGVPVKMEMDMDVGGAAGKSHRSIRYEYSNVKAPPGI